MINELQLTASHLHGEITSFGGHLPLKTQFIMIAIKTCKINFILLIE